MGLIQGQKLCSNCWYDLITQKSFKNCTEMIDNESTVDEATVMTEEFNSNDLIRSDLDSAAQSLGCSPIKYHSRHEDKEYYVKKKVHKMDQAIKKKLCTIMEISPASDLEKNDNCQKCNDLDQLMNQLKEKFKASSTREKIKILTLVPESWSRKKIQKHFKATKHMVDMSSKLRRKKGILSEIKRKKTIQYQLKHKIK